MVALVYAKTTTTYTRSVMSDTYVACRTKWRLATGAYRLAEMLDADWSVDLSVGGASLIWRKVFSPLRKKLADWRKHTKLDPPFFWPRDVTINMITKCLTQRATKVKGIFTAHQEYSEPWMPKTVLLWATSKQPWRPRYCAPLTMISQ